jgi:hypothetical protein
VPAVGSKARPLGRGGTAPRLAPPRSGVQPAPALGSQAHSFQHFLCLFPPGC